MVGSPPPCRAAMMMARLSLLNSLPRLASMAPFLCLIVAQCECPDMAPPSNDERSTMKDERKQQRQFLPFIIHRSSFVISSYRRVQELELAFQVLVPGIHFT